jgi:hypothetical protein
MPLPGLEPGRPFEHTVLSRACLPFQPERQVLVAAPVPTSVSIGRDQLALTTVLHTGCAERDSNPHALSSATSSTWFVYLIPTSAQLFMLNLAYTRGKIF